MRRQRLNANAATAETPSRANASRAAEPLRGRVVDPLDALDDILHAWTLYAHSYLDPHQDKPHNTLAYYV